MKSDTIKTIIGLIVIGGIVVATFMYGNAQRQAQLNHDQEVKKQQEAKANPASPSASPTATPAVTAATGGSSNTAPVTSPTSNSIQGSASATPTPAATATPAASPAVAGATTVPDTGGTGEAAPLPDTGPEMIGMLGMGSIGVMALAVRRSRKATIAAMRSKRL